MTLAQAYKILDPPIYFPPTPIPPPGGGWSEKPGTDRVFFYAVNQDIQVGREKILALSFLELNSCLENCLFCG